MKKQVWFIARFMAYLATNALWPLVFLLVCRLAKRLNRPVFGFIFLVYPGTLDQVQGYVPLWYRSFAPMVSIIGMVTGKQKGLVVTIPWLLEELEEENHRHERLARVIHDLAGLAEQIGAKAVALAGRLPGVLLRNGYQLEKPFVVGDMGAVYTVLMSLREGSRSANIDLPASTVGILGSYGFLGSKVTAAIRQDGCGQVIAIDPRLPTGTGNGNQTRDPARLKECQAVVVLTARGEQMETTVGHLMPGTIVVDDTHPQLPRRLISAIEKKGGQIIKATLTLDDTRFLPRLPKWQADWLPGCCVEAIVVAASNGTAIASQEDFNRLADRLGFKAPVVKHKSEL